jgi:DNA replication protein DnaC
LKIRIRLQPIDNHDRMAFLKIIEDRNGKNSLIITSQLPVSQRYDIIGDKTADSTMDRLVPHANCFVLHGESMGNKKPKLETQFNREIKHYLRPFRLPLKSFF